MQEPEVRKVPVADCLPTADNPRVIDEKAEAFRHLVESVRASGVLVPVAVRPHATRAGKLDLRYGERRWRAAKIAGVKEIPALVFDGLSDAEAFELTFAENFLREDLTPIEESKAVATLLARNNGDARAAAAKLGRSETWVRLRAGLQNIVPEWLEALAEDGGDLADFGAGHLALVARLPKEAQVHLLDMIRWDNSRMSVAQFESYINGKFLRVLSGAPWELSDALLCPAAGACSACLKRSSCEPGLFGGEDGTVPAASRLDKCLDPQCWKVKEAAYLAARKATLEAEHPDLLYVSTDPGAWRIHDDLKKQYGKVLERYDFSRTKKTTAGARPALVVAGKGMGKVVYIQPARRAEAAVAKAKPGPPSLAARRQALEARRWAWIIDCIKERLQRRPALAIADPVLYWRTATALATVYGAGALGGDWKAVDAFLAKPDLLPEHLWSRVTGRLVLELMYYRKNEIGAGLRTSAERIAGLLGLDLAGLQAEAAAEIPEPKSWKHLKPDGTPKAAKKPAARKGEMAEAFEAAKKGTADARTKEQAPEAEGRKPHRSAKARKAGGPGTKKRAARGKAVTS